MRSGTYAALASVWMLAAPAFAQSTTEDGIRATLHGDYKAAARILKPLADDFEHPDPVAQFFLAVLYEVGEGVRRDEGHACGLFLRSASREHPFAVQSAALATNLRNQYGDGASLICPAQETFRGGPPQTIRFGPEHQITFTDTSVVLVHGEQETRTLWKWPPEAIILPIRYTPVEVTKPLSATRQFLQLFQWLPDDSRNPSSWTLTWGLLEVQGDQWLMPAWEKDAAVVDGSARPDARDVGSFVRVRVNANGEAEFSILSGPRARTEVIPWKAGQ
jgi:hypothetical protein